MELTLTQRRATAQVPTSTHAARPDRAWLFQSSGLIALTLLVGVPALGDWCGLSPDSFAYLGAARSIWEQGGWGDARLVHPPGYSLLLAPLIVQGELPFAAIRIFSLLCWVASVLLTWLLMRPLLGRPSAWLTAALLATSPIMLIQSTRLLSEMAFLPAMLGCLWLAVRWQSRPEIRRSELLLGGLLAAAAILIRSMGIMLVPILLIALASRRRDPAAMRWMNVAIFLIALAVLPALWHLRQSAYPAAYGYGSIWTTARQIEATDATGIALQFERLLQFGPQRLADIKAAILPAHLAWRAFTGPASMAADWLIGGGVVALLLARLLLLRSLIDLYALLTLVMLALWPWEEGPRLVLPLLPIFWAAIVWAAKSAAAHVPVFNASPSIRGAAIISVALILGYELLLTHQSLDRSRRRTADRWFETEQIAQWQRAHMPPEAGFLGYVPRADQAKVTLLGASYLSRRPAVGIVECGHRGPEPQGFDQAEYIFLHEASATDCTTVQQATFFDRIGPFSIFRRECAETSPGTQKVGRQVGGAPQKSAIAPRPRQVMGNSAQLRSPGIIQTPLAAVIKGQSMLAYALLTLASSARRCVGQFDVHRAQR